MTEDLAGAAAAVFPRARADLEDLVRIPSVSAPQFDPEPVRRSAEATRALLAEAGYQGVRLLDYDGAHPAVYGELPGPTGAPTVVLYAHHDVQPPGDDDGWESEPFEPTEREGRLYGRGVADDKSGIVTHASIARIFEGSPPVNLKVFVEGEEETGSAHLAGLFREHGALLASDMIMLADTGNWRSGVPSLTTSLRGLIAAHIDVHVLESGVHSGQFGGALPDALTILTRLTASLHDAEGNVAVPGLFAYECDPLDLTEEELHHQAGALEGVRTIGSGALTSRLWSRPAAAVLAIDAPPVSQAINQLIPRARAKVSLRLAPGDDPDRAMRALIDHITSQDAWGARVEVTPVETGRPFALSGPDPRLDAVRSGFEEAWGRPPVDIGVGGTIPFVAAFSDAYPDAAIVLDGPSAPESRAHGPNENLELDELKRFIHAEAAALRNLGEI